MPILHVLVTGMVLLLSFVNRQIIRYGGRLRQPPAIGWMASSAVMVPRGPTIRVEYGSSRVLDDTKRTNKGTSFQSMQALVSKLHQPTPLRAAQHHNENTKTTRSEQNRRKSELALDICAQYRHLPPLRVPLSEECERSHILLFLAMDCIPSEEDVNSAVTRYRKQTSTIEAGPTDATRRGRTVCYGLRTATTPNYETVLKYILQQNASHGMSFLVTLREDLLRVIAWMKSIPDTHDARLAHLIDLDGFLRSVFCTWFSPGMLGKSKSRGIICSATLSVSHWFFVLGYWNISITFRSKAHHV